MNTEELQRLILSSLDTFYTRRINALSDLKLRKALTKKNPYLLRAVGVNRASEIVERVLRDYMAASDEAIFGDAFFEPIAKICSGGTVSPSEGVDIAIETDTVYKAVSVKSGPSIFNASQAKRMNEEFLALRSRLQKLQKQFDPVLGHGYGRKASAATATRIYRTVAGQAFWEELTGDPEFYVKLVTLMRDAPDRHRARYQEEWDRALNRFTAEFLRDFATETGDIVWERLVRFNSGASAPRDNPKT